MVTVLLPDFATFAVVVAQVAEEKVKILCRLAKGFVNVSHSVVRGFSQEHSYLLEERHP